MSTILSLQAEIEGLQAGFRDALDADAVDELAAQSSLSVLAERLATIRTKASGKQKLIEVMPQIAWTNSRLHFYIFFSVFHSYR